MIGIAIILIGILFIVAGMKQQSPVAFVKSFLAPPSGAEGKRAQ